MPQAISTKDFDAKVQELGSVGAAVRWAKENGYDVKWDDGSMELPPTASSQPAGALNAVAGADKTKNTAPPSGGLGSFDEVIGELIAYPNKRKKEREAAFTQGQQYIAQAYAAPSVSSQLFALSKALLSPKPYRGFAGTMANVSSALSDISQSQEEAKRKRALAEIELQNSLDKGISDDYEESLKLRFQAAKSKYEAEKNAAMPKYDPLSSGGYQIRPGTGGLPPMPTMDQYGNYVITDPRQIAFLPPNTKIVRPGDNPMKPKYVPARSE